MTFAEEFVPEGQDNATPDYPVAFGVTFTPTVIGVLCGLAGIVGAIAIVMYLIMPIWTEYQTLQTSKQDKENQIQQKQAGKADEKIKELEAKLQIAETLKPQILSLFSQEKDLNTLLLDLNSQVDARKADMITFKPQQDPITIITDGSYGEQVNNKLKLQSFSMTIEGTFEQTKNILVNFERLQSFLVIKGLQSEVSEEPIFLFDKGKLNIQGQPKLKTSFNIDVLLPLSEAELAKIAAEAKAAAEQQQQQPQ
jgi:hypothetical protein